MPIARFYGILIYMHYFDHNPPHLHGRHESLYGNVQGRHALGQSDNAVAAE